MIPIMRLETTIRTFCQAPLAGAPGRDEASLHPKENCCLICLSMFLFRAMPVWCPASLRE